MTIRYPASVILPTAPIAPAGAVYAAIGASRQRIANWRSNHNFPASEGRKIDVASVAAWLVERGVKVEWS